MDTRERLAKVINLFQHLTNFTLASEAKSALKCSATILQALSNNPEINDDKLKSQTDLIIVGSVIHALCIHANKYNVGTRFTDHFLYSRKPQAVWKGLSELKGENLFIAIGQRALQTKTLPFTGRFDDMKYKNREGIMEPIFQGYDENTREVYTLDSLFEENHFQSYGLNTDPITVDPTVLNQPGKEKRAQDEADRSFKEEQEKKNNKWHKPFGLAKDTSLFSVSRNAKQADAFSCKKENFIQRIDAFQHEHNMRLLKWAGYALLAAVVSPFTLFISLAFTVPWLKKEYENIQEMYDDRDIVTLEFTVEEYDAVIAKRAEVKAEFLNQTFVTKDPNKPEKVCVAFDADGDEVTTQEENHKTTTRVLMYCDKAQAKRWSLSFLETATQETYKQTIENSVTIEESYCSQNNPM